MATAEPKEPLLEAIESDDGSAVVEVDEKDLQANESDEQNGFERAKEGGEVTDQADDDHPDDDEDLRNAKRNRRRAKRT
jgi:hypothetical protein